MLTDEEIASIWARQFALVKPYLKDGHIVAKPVELGSGGTGLPELWPGYGRSVSDRRRALPHIEPGHYADDLFLQRAPNQSEEEFAYVRANYKQTTLPVFADMENTIGRVWSEGNWSLTFSDDALSAYVQSGIREWGSLANFFRFALLRLKLSDPMGLITVLPETVAVMTDADGNTFTDPSAVPEPVPAYHQCGMVWGFEYDRWYLIRLHEDSELDAKAKGIKCWLIDDTDVYLIEQYGRQNDWTFRTTLLYAHGCGEPPCVHMMGVPSIQDGHLLWLSPFAPARELLDIALADSQYLQVSKVKSIYPQRVVVGEVCEYRDAGSGAMCISGSLTYIEDGHPVVKECPMCNGTGRKARLGPLNDLVITPSTATGESTAINATNALTYVAPSTDSARFTREEITAITEAARSILHLGKEAPMAGGDAKTATEAGLDNRAKDAFVKSIADQVFEIFALSLRYTATQRGAGDEAYSLRRPVVYDLRTVDDRLAEINAARTAQLPFVTVAKMGDDATRALFTHDDRSMDMVDATMLADRLAMMSDTVVASELSAGRVQPWEMLLHYSAPALYAQVLSHATSEITTAQVAQAMQALAKAAAPEPASPADRIGTLLT